MSRIKILIADDHPLVRESIRNILARHPDFEVVGEAENGEEALKKTEDLLPDVLLIDISMPKLSGIEAARIVRREFPSTRVLVLTGYDNEEYVYQIVKSGAGGYVLKDATKEELARAICAVMKGEKFFSPRVSKIIAEGYVRRIEGGDDTPGEGSAADVPLTKREREILTLVAQGLTNQEIADQLFISPRTVDTHRTNIMQKLDIHDVANLVRYAIEHGFLHSQ